MARSKRGSIPTSARARVQAGRDATVEFEVSAAPPSVQDFIHHVYTKYPLRVRRLRKDSRWLRKQAVKYGIDPDQVMRSL
jgi:hypothetical protein